MAEKKAAKKAPVKREDKVIAPERRSLEDLYVFGAEKVVDDGRGGVTVWIQKISPAEEKQALKPSRAARSGVAIKKRLDRDHPDFVDYIYQLEDYGLTSREDKCTLILQARLEETRASIEKRVAGEDKWSDDDYLIGLQDAWTGGLYDKFLEDSQDEEALRVLEELEKYTEEVNGEFIPTRDDLFSELSHLSDEEIDVKAAEALIDNEATHLMIEEFRFQKVFFAVRDPEDHSKRYFGSVDRVKNLQSQVFDQLEAAYDEISVGIMEGKD